MGYMQCTLADAGSHAGGGALMRSVLAVGENMDDYWIGENKEYDLSIFIFSDSSEF